MFVCVHTYSTISLLCCINRVTVKKHIETVLMSRIYPDAHGKVCVCVQRLFEVVEDACGIKNEGVSSEHMLSLSLYE